MQALWRRLKNPASIHVASLTTSSYAGAAIGLFRTICEARILGPVDFGFAALVLAYPRFVWSFSTVKSLSITSRYISEYRALGRDEELRAVCKLGYLVDVGAMLVALLLVLATGHWAIAAGLAPPGSFGLMIVYGASLPIWGLYGTSRAVLSSWRAFGWLSVAHGIDAVVTLVLVVGALLAGFGVPGLVVAMAAAQVVSGLLLFALATRVLAEAGHSQWWRVPLRSLAPLTRETAPLLGWNYVTTTLGGILAQGPILILGRSRGPVEAGYFRLATTIVGATAELPVSMGRVVFPTLSEHWARSGSAGLRDTIWRWTSQGGVAVALAMALSVPLLEFAVPLLFGDEYAPMVRGLQWLMLGAALTAPFFWLSPLAYASRRLSAWAVGSALQTAFVIALGLWFAPTFGYPGMAAIAAIGSVAFTFGMLATYAWILRQ